ncbi:hypothetical protein TSAR_005527, partial [Trichomalopsis sarcophagae]
MSSAFRFSGTSYEVSESSHLRFFYTYIQKLDARMKFLIAFLALTSLCHADVSHILQAQGAVDYQEPTTTTQGPPNPYSFKYSAGRYPGHIDRVQSESGDGFGHVRGSYSFIDPKFKVRTVQYTVDENGFHPTLNNYDDILRQPTDSEAVKQGRERHRILYENIAARNSQGAQHFIPQ